MKIIVFVLTYNNADVVPFFLRHYSTFADEISAFDDFSTDGTRELLEANPKVLLRNWPHPGSGIDEVLFLNHWKEWYQRARGGFDWVIIADSDEIIYAPDIRKVLSEQQALGYEVVRTNGWNMTGKGLPKDDGRQIWEISPMGVRAPVYSKPVVFQPHAQISWNLGKHALQDCNPKVTPTPLLKLLHYRYMGSAYTRKKNAKNYARCGLATGDKAAAWSNARSYDGPDKEHSPQWADFAHTKAINALEAPFYD
jgi:glycosyltransferase involved in cell wall biosynthesis